MNSIGQKISDLRKERGLSMEELGIALGVSRAQVSLYENNKSSPNTIMIEKLAKSLKVHPIYFFVDHSDPGDTPDKLELKMIALQRENDRLRIIEKAKDEELRKVKDELMEAMRNLLGLKKKDY